MTSTPNQSDLVHVADEVSSLKSIVPEACVLENPSKKEVVSKIQNCIIAHFACHGKSTLDDPSKSHLMLADWETESFSVADIVALKLTKPRFAYLSACYTANAQIEELLDESIHIAGACLLAGFSGVIGTLWRVDDRCSADVSRSVYQAMSRNMEFEFENAGVGLHNAVKQVREKAKGYSPLQWAAYIHMGV
jgi:CHAT domain-containing protein